MMGQPGKSIPDQPIGNRDEMAEWVSDTLDHLGLRQTHLAGYSYGGFAALNYAMHAPNRVEKLILLSPAGGLVPLRMQFYLRGAVNRLVATLPGVGWLSMNSLFHWMFYEPNLQKAEMRQIAERILNQMFLGNKYFQMGTIVLPTTFNDEELRTVRSPTLLLIGEKEALYDAGPALTRARQLIPHIRAELMPQAGHDLPVSQAQTVNQEILQFLKE
jgi:pimeloyl-ACP methyl ester carboxylesterase